MLNRLSLYVNSSTRIILLFFVIVGLLIYGFYASSALSFVYPLDYGEAPLVDQAIRLRNGDNIYRPILDTPPYAITNYPPIYLLTLLPFTNNLTTAFQMGRAVSVVAALATAVFIALIVHTLSKNRVAALVAAATFLAIPYVVAWSGLLRIDLLALALSMAGLTIFIRWPSSRLAMIGGGLLLLAAIYTRQSYALAAPLAAFGWLWQEQGRRRALELTAVVGGLGLLLFLVLTLLTGGGFFFHIVRANVNAFSWERVWELFRAAGELMPVLIVSGLLLIILGYKKVAGWQFLALYLLGGFLSALTIGKVGSNINYFLELSAALSLLVGMMLAWRQDTRWQSSLLMLLLALQLGWLVRGTMERLDAGLSSRRQDQGAISQLELLLINADGPVLADEYMGLLTRPNRPLHLQPFEVSQLANDGVWDQTPLLQEIGNQIFPYILIHHFSPYPLYRERWTPEMLEAIETHYRPSQTLAGTVVYTPKEGLRGVALTNDPAQNRTFIPEVRVGDLTAVTDVFAVAQPFLTINTQNPQHLAASVTSASDMMCEFPDCEIGALLYTSQDGGQSWQGQAPFTAGRAVNASPLAAFAPDGTLFVLGIRDGVVTLNSSTAADDYEMVLANQAPVTRGQVAARSWLQIQPDTGDLFLSYGAQLNARQFVTPSLLRSTSAGERWSSNVRADQQVAIADFTEHFRATWPDDIQIMFGAEDQLAMVWVWDPAPWSWPRDVWMATSDDGGRSFGPPQQLAETWGPISATSENGRYYLTYRTGSETAPELVLATSNDHGQSWQTTQFNDNVALNFDTDKAPGLDVAPNGTIDLMFYAPAESCERTLAEWGEQLGAGNLVDRCTYDIYYTYSKDDGRSFSQPLKLNETAVVGEQFIQAGGLSQPGTHMSMASTDATAYPLWIATEGAGTQAMTVRIER